MDFLWSPYPETKTRVRGQFRANFFTLPALQKASVDYFFGSAWGFCNESQRGFLVNIWWCQFPRKQSMSLEKFGEVSFWNFSDPKIQCKIWDENSKNSRKFRSATFLTLLGNVQEHPTGTTCLRSTAIHLRFVWQYDPHLYRCAFLASKPRSKGNAATHLQFALQYASYLCCNTPPICTENTFEKVPTNTKIIPWGSYDLKHYRQERLFQAIQREMCSSLCQMSISE